MEYKTQKQRDFEKLYKELKDDIYKVALYVSRHPQASEEITQMAFYQLFLHYDIIRLDSVRAYTIRTAKNLAFNWLKYGFRDLIFDSDEIIGFHINMDRSAEEYCLERDENAQARSLSEDILTALKKKNQLWYEAIVKSYVFEIPQDELARQLGIDKATLQSRLYRAKKWIRKRYREQFDEIYKPV